MRLIARRARATCLAGFVAAVVVASGCGNGLPPVLTSEFQSGGDDGSKTPDAGMGLSLDLEAGPPPSCSAGTAGGVCGCLELNLLGDPPNLYFILDRSGSMQTDNKWTTIRGVVADVMRKLGPRAKFGAAVFPDPHTNSCDPGIELMPVRLGDTPAGQWGPTTALFNDVTAGIPQGGTPTSSTLTALRAKIAALPGHTFVILATDGGPNCNEAATCDQTTCIPNLENEPGCDATTNCCATLPAQCLDSKASVAAVKAIAITGSPVYVVGVPGSGPYGALLDQLAVAGGTARPTEPQYYAVTSNDQSAFASALSSIAAQITATCTLQLSAAPPDPTQVNVYLDGKVVAQDPTNGWTLSGQTITLVGDTCTKVMAGDVLELRVVAGCPTVIK